MIEQKQKKLAIFCAHMVVFHSPGHIYGCILCTCVIYTGSIV